jgi:hypothetical protein
VAALRQIDQALADLPSQGGDPTVIARAERELLDQLAQKSDQPRARRLATLVRHSAVMGDADTLRTVAQELLDAE